MLLLLCIFTPFLLGVLNLFFEAVPMVLSNVYHFSLQEISMSFTGLMVGMPLGIIMDPYGDAITSPCTLALGYFSTRIPPTPQPSPAAS
jgi:hypothetical protein